jgi:zinc D-Ala-D-Ala carboxypeptidase
MNTPHFRPDELSGLSERLVEMLEKAREIAGTPFILTSGYRAPDQNSAAGGVPTSLHMQGLAVDIRWPESAFEREKMCFALGAAGFKQAGFYDKHVHVELDPKDNYAFWTGVSH